MIITIDGPSGTGKSTVAKGVAAQLGFTFFDTGAMYRSFAWFVLREGVDPTNEQAVGSVLDRFHYKIDGKGGERRYFVGAEEVTDQIRTQSISLCASQVAIHPTVRQAMVKIQREFGHAVDAVFEGRDMGTVVFPDADLKIFLSAEPEVRAKRRYLELSRKFPDVEVDENEILCEIKARDESDSTRAVSPLKKAPDAIFIDTSHLSANQVIAKIIALRPKRKFPKMKFSYAVTYWLARLFFKCFFGLKIYGLEHFRSGAAILAANHASLYDPPVLSISCPEEVHFLAKEALFDIPLLGRLIRMLNSHPISRDASDVQTFKEMLKLLAEGKKLMIFPEGQRSFDGAMLPLERGMAFLAQKAQCRIIPAYIEGSFQAWPRSRKLPHLTGKMRVAFGSPIEWRGGMDKREAEKRLTEETERSLKALKAWLEAGARGTPP